MSLQFFAAFSALVIIARASVEYAQSNVDAGLLTVITVFAIALVIGLLCAINMVLQSGIDADASRKDPLLLAPGSIERYTRPRRIKPWLIVWMVVAATGWVLKGFV